MKKKNKMKKKNIMKKKNRQITHKSMLLEQ